MNKDVEFKEALAQRLFGPEVKKFQRKQLEILDAFAESLAEDGLQDTSYASVAKRLGMQPAHLVYYFPTWVSMLEGCFRYAIHTAQELTVRGIQEAKTPRAQIRAVVYAPFVHFHQFPTHRYVIYAYQMQCVREESSRKAHREVRALGQKRLALLLNSLTGEKRSDNLFLAQSIQRLIVGYAMDWMSSGSPASWKAAAEEAWTHIELLLPKADK